LCVSSAKILILAGGSRAKREFMRSDQIRAQARKNSIAAQLHSSIRELKYDFLAVNSVPLFRERENRLSGAKRPDKVGLSRGATSSRKLKTRRQRARKLISIFLSFFFSFLFKYCAFCCLPPERSTMHHRFGRITASFSPRDYVSSPCNFPPLLRYSRYYAYCNRLFVVCGFINARFVMQDRHVMSRVKPRARRMRENKLYPRRQVSRKDLVYEKAALTALPHKYL